MRECRQSIGTLRWNRGAPLTDEPATHVRAKDTDVRRVVATDTYYVRSDGGGISLRRGED